MPIRAITFDCAQTLIEVAWNPEDLLCEAAKSIGLQLPADAATTYQNLYLGRFPEFLQVNLLKSPAEGRKFHDLLNHDWLAALACDPLKAPELTFAAENLVFGPDTRVFRLYSETLEAMKRLTAKRLVLGVVSNWDFSLHRVLQMFGLSRFLHTAVASLEEGVEKPDPKLFEIALARLGCRPDETLHIGDDPIDDIQGAHNSGIRAALIDRTQKEDLPYRLNSLLQISEVVDCLG